MLFNSEYDTIVDLDSAIFQTWNNFRMEFYSTRILELDYPVRLDRYMYLLTCYQKNLNNIITVFKENQIETKK